jgi:hypothetical protein
MTKAPPLPLDDRPLVTIPATFEGRTVLTPDARAGHASGMTLLVRSRTESELPLPVVRWLEVAWPDGIEPVDTITLAGPVRMRRGRIPLHGDTTMRFRLGTGYVSDIRIGAGPITAMRGLDALVDGTGITVVGHEASTGYEIDQGTFLALWSQSLLFPASWSRLPGIRLTPVTDDEVIVTLPFRGGVETGLLRFDPAVSAFPVAFQVDRFREVGKPKLGWRASYEEWHWRDGLALPTRLRVQWADDDAPWFDMRVDDVVANEPLEAHEDRARAAIAEAHRLA